jgi:hypothetical protein
VIPQHFSIDDPSTQSDDSVGITSEVLYRFAGSFEFNAITVCGAKLRQFGHMHPLSFVGITLRASHEAGYLDIGQPWPLVASSKGWGKVEAGSIVLERVLGIWRFELFFRGLLGRSGLSW